MSSAFSVKSLRSLDYKIILVAHSKSIILKMQWNRKIYTEIELLLLDITEWLISEQCSRQALEKPDVYIYLFVHAHVCAHTHMSVLEC